MHHLAVEGSTRFVTAGVVRVRIGVWVGIRFEVRVGVTVGVTPW